MNLGARSGLLSHMYADPPALVDLAPAPVVATAPPRSLPEPPAPRVAAYPLLALVICAGWAGAVWVGAHHESSPVLHDVALFAHLVCLVVGFGAVLTLDWFATLWLLGRRTLPEVLRLASGVHVMIWAGLVGLTTSGMLLSPQLHGLTWVKLVVVLGVALNGLNAHHLQGRLELASLPMSRAVMVRAGLTGAASQVGWWTACVIGYLNAT